MQEFEFVPHVLFPLSSLLISSPTAVILSRQSLTARFAESRYSFPVCVCECVCESVRATGRAEPALVCLALAFEASSNPAPLLFRLRPRKAPDWSIFRSIHGCQSRSVLSVPPSLSLARSLSPYLYLLPYPLLLCLHVII